jgi:carbon storage regulator
MLVLTRRPGETLIIDLPTGEQVKVTVLSVKGNQVRLGLDAPAEIQILREELREPVIT